MQRDDMAGDLAARRLRTFFVGTETSRNPLLPKLQAIGKQLIEEELCEGPGVLSARYGKRIVITTGGAALGALKDTDFVEIVDYDPSRNRCLLMGKAEPTMDAAVHWLIYNNREEVGAILHVQDPIVIEVNEATRMFPESRAEKLPGPVEVAVEALKLLRKSSYCVVRGHGCFAVAKTPEAALALAMRAREQALEVIEEAEGVEGDPGVGQGSPPGPRR
jgi:ribulose-5-phosphate 4-epimerase/fuculose-1-phosphate aldolase